MSGYGGNGGFGVQMSGNKNNTGNVQPFSGSKYGSNIKGNKGYDPDLESGNLKQSQGFFSGTGGSANKNKPLTAS